MAAHSRFSLLLLLLTVASLLPPALSSAPSNSARRAASYSKYTSAHSIGDSYSFDPRDGWTSVNVTNLSYKYRRDDENTALENRHENHKHDDDTKHDAHADDSKSKKKKKTKTKSKGSGKTFSASSVGDVVKGAAKAIMNGLKGIGKSEEVKITWYTGHDLENPSCWPSVDWAPTDQSFACALTLVGWTTRPQCFNFLELCNGPSKCVFVRVVDSCAGCDPGSKHVDLTKAAFAQLAEIETGVTQVQMRMATNPDDWFIDLWGPKA